MVGGDGVHDADQDAHEHGPRFHDECYACPVGGFFLTARSASPETVEHLVNAASEMVAAFRSMAEAAERFLESQRGPTPTAEPRVRRIPVDDD